MANEISKINRKIKASMKRYIDHDDPGALKSVLDLVKKREAALSPMSFEERKEKMKKDNRNETV
jgi:hypothetical protein